MARCATASPWSTPSTATSARGSSRSARSRSASSAARSPRIAGALDALHRGHACTATSRRSTSSCAKANELKLGDFGIATHQLSRRGVTADAFNLFHVPNEIAWGRVRRWQKRDDVYQIGLLAAMLLRGDITSPMRSKDVRSLPCSDHLKEVIHRCLGSRGKRYESARELIAALRKPPKEPRLGRVASLEGKRVSFTGFLVRPRADAIKAARKAGAFVQSKPGPVDRHPRARPAERAADRRQGRRVEADRGSPARRAGDQGDGDRRAAVLEARRRCGAVKNEESPNSPRLSRYAPML